MKIVVWNVNGLRAVSKKNVRTEKSFHEFIRGYDVVVLNETKIDCDKLKSQSDVLIPSAFSAYHSCARKKGYSGVSILTKQTPLRRIQPSFDDDEGRIVILEYATFILVGVYVPNSGSTDTKTKMPKRIAHRTNVWDAQFRDMCISLEKIKPIIVAGDCNVAFTELDLHSPKTNRRQAGFTDAERNGFAHLLQDTTLIDLWRLIHPNKVQYTYYDYRTKARERNAGWRIDYFLVSKHIYNLCRSCDILADVVGSDHVPVELVLLA